MMSLDGLPPVVIDAEWRPVSRRYLVTAEAPDVAACAFRRLVGRVEADELATRDAPVRARFPAPQGLRGLSAMPATTCSFSGGASSSAMIR